MTPGIAGAAEDGTGFEVELVAAAQVEGTIDPPDSGRENEPAAAGAGKAGEGGLQRGPGVTRGIRASAKVGRSHHPIRYPGRLDALEDPAGLRPTGVGCGTRAPAGEAEGGRQTAGETEESATGEAGSAERHGATVKNLPGGRRTAIAV